MPTEREKAVATVEFESVDPIRGHVGDGSGSTRPFTGWIALISALQETVTRAQPQGEADGEDSAAIRRR